MSNEPRRRLALDEDAALTLPPAAATVASMGRWISCLLIVAASACATGGHIDGRGRVDPSRDGAPRWSAVSLSSGMTGIGFDDVRYVPSLDRVLIPAGHTGTLALLAPATEKVVLVGGFSAQAAFRGGHDIGPTSADAGDGVIVVSDRTARAVDIVDAARNVIVSSTPLGSKPDLVRFVAKAREVWVTEPDSERIEVLEVSRGDRPVAVHRAFIGAPGGPEALTIDRTRGRAYTHLGATTAAVDLETRLIVKRWTTGCAAPSGLALDETGGLLFVGCSDGQVAVVDLSTNEGRTRTTLGSSIDHIAFSASRRHLYVPDTKSARLTTLSVSQDGQLTALGTLETVPGTECVTTDDRGHVYLCDPEHGRILVVWDPYPDSRTPATPGATRSGR